LLKENVLISYQPESIMTLPETVISVSEIRYYFR